MKFYQTIAPMILCIIYTTTIFGMFGIGETTLPYVPRAICNLIDEFRGKNYGLYKKTRHIKPYSRLLNRMTNHLVASRLSMQFPAEVTILDDQENIIIRELVDRGTRKIEIRSLSDMKPKNIEQSDKIIQSYRPFHRQHLVKRNELTYLLKNGKIDIYLPDDNYKPDYKLRSLPAPANITIFDVFEDENIVITINKNGSLDKWELQEHTNLYEIINPIMDTD